MVNSKWSKAQVQEAHKDLTFVLYGVIFSIVVWSICAWDAMLQFVWDGGILPFPFIIPVFIASFTCFITGVLVLRLLIKRWCESNA